MADARPIPAAIRQKRKDLEAAATPPVATENLLANVVPIQPGQEQPADQQATPPAPTPESDDFAERFVGVTAGEPVVTIDAGAPPAAPPLAPTPAPLAPPAAQEPPVAPVSFVDLFADSQSAPPAPAPVAAEPNPELTALREQVTQLTEMLSQRAESQTPTPAAPAFNTTVDAHEIGLSAEEAETYSSSLPVIQRVVSAVLAKTVGPALAQIEALRADVSQLSGLRSDFANYRGQTYKQQLYATIPDIDAVVSRPEFAQFIAQQVPYTNDTVRTRLGRAHAEEDLVTVSAIIRDFRRVIGGSNPGDVMHMAAPVSSAAPAAPSVPSTPESAKTPVPWSKMAEATRLKNAGRMTSEEYQKVKAFYDKAIAEDRVDYNS